MAGGIEFLDPTGESTSFACSLLMISSTAGSTESAVKNVKRVNMCNWVCVVCVVCVCVCVYGIKARQKATYFVGGLV
jgi:hypothetical protein